MWLAYHIGEHQFCGTMINLGTGPAETLRSSWSAKICTCGGIIQGMSHCPAMKHWWVTMNTSLNMSAVFPHGSKGAGLR